MRISFALLMAASIAVTAAGAVHAHAPSVRLVGKPPPLVADEAWQARFSLLRSGRPLAGLQPRFWIRGPAARSFPGRALGGGRYVARVVFPKAGRYRFGVAVEEFSFPLGSVTVRRAGVSVRRPIGLVVGPDGAVYVADNEGTSVVRIDPRTRTRTIAARGLDKPSYVTFDREDRLLVVDSRHRIFLVTPGGDRVHVAGTGRRAHTGDGGPATTASLAGAGGMDVDADGRIVIAEYDGWIRVVEPDGTIGSIAGNGTEGYSGDGGPAARSVLRHPHDVAVLSDGVLAVADSHNQAIRIISSDGVIRTLVAGLGAPVGVAPAPNGGVYVAEGDGRITLVRRNGRRQRLASADTPFGIASDANGNVYFSELTSNRVKRLDGRTRAISILLP